MVKGLLESIKSNARIIWSGGLNFPNGPDLYRDVASTELLSGLAIVALFRTHDQVIFGSIIKDAYMEIDVGVIIMDTFMEISCTSTYLHAYSFTLPIFFQEKEKE